MKVWTAKAPIIAQVADVLRQARKLRVGPDRNNLRQLARGLLKLHRAGLRANVQTVETPIAGTLQNSALQIQDGPTKPGREAGPPTAAGQPEEVFAAIKTDTGDPASGLSLPFTIASVEETAPARER